MANNTAPTARKLAFSVAIQTITMKRVKKSKLEPRSFCPTINTTLKPQAPRRGSRSRGSGSWNGPTFHVFCLMSSRVSARYAAKNNASASLANSPGWKLIGPMLTQMRAPPDEKPRLGTIGSISNPAPTTKKVHLNRARSLTRCTTSRVAANAATPMNVHVVCKPARRSDRRAIIT